MNEQYCNQCFLSFGQAETKWQYKEDVYHGRCVAKVYQRLQEEDKDEAEKFRLEVQPVRST